MRRSSSNVGNYEVLARLGQGGMADVFYGRVCSGPREGWPVAIKRLLPSLSGDPLHQQLFAREAGLSRQLLHPNVVRVYEVGEVRGTSFIAMEHIDGRDVGQLVRRCAKRGIDLPVDFAVFLARCLLEALAYAHSAAGPDGAPLGIVHCDISPSNLFISRTGEIKLGDFGVARTFLGKDLEPSTVAGKVYYLSPEMIAGEVTPAADLWAAAVTLYELLALQRPFSGATPEQVMKEIRKRRYVPIRERRPQVSPELEAVLQRAFSKRPRDRFQTAAEFAQTLAPLYDEHVGTPLAIAAVVRGLFGANEDRTKQV